MSEQEELETLKHIYDEELEALENMETEDIRDLVQGYVGMTNRTMLIQVATQLREDFWW
jgi:hypothetical protein